MKNKIVLVFLSFMLVTSLAALGACTLLQQQEILPGGETALPDDETAIEVLFLPDLTAEAESSDSVHLTFTSTLPKNATSGTYDIRCSTEPITQANCLRSVPILPQTATQTSRGEPVPGADIFIEQEPDDEPIVADDASGEIVNRFIKGLEANTTYYFVAWIITESLESYDYAAEDDGDYKFTGVDIPDDAYRHSMPGVATCTTLAVDDEPVDDEPVIEVLFQNVESEPSVILEIKKDGDVVLKIKETLIAEPNLTFYAALWTPDLGSHYWYGYADWIEKWPQYTFGFAETAAQGPGDYNTARDNSVSTVCVSSDGDNITWVNKGDYLGLMNKLGEAMDEIGSRNETIDLLEKQVPGFSLDLISEVELGLDEVNRTDYAEALAQLAAKLPYKGSEVRNPGDVTYEKLEDIEQAIQASVIVISKVVDLSSFSPTGGGCMATGNKGGFAVGGFNAA